MKRIACLLLCGVLLTMLSACGGSEPSPAETETPAESITFTDDLGREVTLAKPSRVDRQLCRCLVPCRRTGYPGGHGKRQLDPV